MTMTDRLPSCWGPLNPTQQCLQQCLDQPPAALQQEAALWLQSAAEQLQQQLLMPAGRKQAAVLQQQAAKSTLATCCCLQISPNRMKSSLVACPVTGRLNRWVV